MNGNISTMKQRISSAKKFTCTRDEYKTVVLPWVLQHVVSCWSGSCSPFNCTLSTLCTAVLKVNSVCSSPHPMLR